YDVVARERREFRHRANARLAVNMLEQSVPLRHEQRQQLIALLISQIKPPRKSGAMDYYLIMYRASQLPEAKLRPLFDELQWKIVSRQLAAFKGYRQFLKQAGQFSE